MGDDPRAGEAWRLDPGAYLISRPREHAIPEPRSAYLSMRDGVRLATDLYLPDDADGPWPAVLIFTPYYRRFRRAEGATAEPSPNIAIYRDMFVPRGYALLVTDVRGTGASFGHRDSFRSPAERADYAEVVAWAAAQPWSDGCLGATGISYLGAAADFAAASGHPALKAIAPISAVWDTYRDHFYPGGCFLTHLARAYGRLCDALDHDDRAALANYAYFKDPALLGPAPVDDDPDGVLLAEALRDHRANANMADFLAEFRFREESLPHDPGFTSDSFSPHAAAPAMRADLAVLSISGWYDGAYANGAIARYLSVPAAHRRLLIGPWDHGARVNGSPWRARETPEFPVLGEILRFFDEHVAGRETGLSDEAPVHLHVMGEEHWTAAQSWPVATGAQRLYPRSEGGLSESPGAATSLDIVADFALGTGRATRYARLAAEDCRSYYPDWAERSAAMPAFASKPLDAHRIVAGHAVLDLTLAIDRTDACVFAYLEDLWPDGRRIYVSEGMLRLLHRREIGTETDAEPAGTYRAAWPLRRFSRADAAPVTPGEEIAVRIPFLPVAWRFGEGHRIGLRLAGADRDNFALWPYGRPGTWQLRLGAQGTSLVLPTLDLGRTSRSRRAA